MNDDRTLDRVKAGYVIQTSRKTGGRRASHFHSVHQLIAARIDRSRPCGGAQMDRVRTATRVELRRARVGAANCERVVAAAEADLQGFDRAVDDAARHAQAGDLGRGQGARVGERVARVVDVQRVAAALAVDRQHRSNAVDVPARGRGQAAHVHRVVVAAGVHGGGRRDRADVHRVGAGTRVDRRDAGDRFERDRVAAAVRVQLRRARVGAGNCERVVAAAEADPQSFDRAVDDLASHTQAVEFVGGQVAGVGERVARIVDVQRVAAAISIDRQHRSDAVDVPARGRGQAAHVHRVGVVARVHRGGRGDRADVHRVAAGTGVDRRDAGDRIERDRVAATARVQLRRAGLGAGNCERVVAAAEADLQSFERAVDDLASHTQAGEFGRGQVARVPARVACVVHVQRVAAAISIDRQHRSDRVDIAAGGRGRAADVHRVGVVACIHRRGRGDRADVDRIVAGTGVDRRDAGDRIERDRVAAAVRVQLRRAGMGAGNCERVVAAAEADLEGLERAVDDLASHTQAGQFGRGQVAGVGERVAGVVDVQRVAAAVSIDRQHRSDPVDVAARGRGQAADVHRVGVSPRVDRGGRGDRADVDRVGAGTGVHRRDAGDRSERDRVAAIVGVQFRRTGVRAGHRERVVPAAEADLQRLDRAVDDLAGHAQARQFRRGQVAGVPGRVSGVIHVQRVAATVTIDRQHRSDAVDIPARGRGQAADVYRVGVAARVHGGGRRDRADVHRVSAGTGVHRRDAGDRFERDRVAATARVQLRHARMGAGNRERVVAAAQADLQGLERAVDDLASHTQAAEFGRG